MAGLMTVPAEVQQERRSCSAVERDAEFAGSAQPEQLTAGICGSSKGISQMASVAQSPRFYHCHCSRGVSAQSAESI
jgi:hypothetical protein